MPREPLDPFGFTREAGPDELDREKRVADRRLLLDHIDWLRRPPLGVYEEIERAIDLTHEGHPEAVIQSADGRSYTASEIIECWEIPDEVLDAYARPASHEDYSAGHWAGY